MQVDLKGAYSPTSETLSQVDRITRDDIVRVSNINNVSLVKTGILLIVSHIEFPTSAYSPIT